MRSTTRTIATLVFGAFLVAACSGAGTTPTPAPVGPATTTPAVTTPTIAPTATPVPMTDGQGPERFVGKVTTGPTVTVDYKQTTVVAPAGNATQLRDGVVTLEIKTNDVRMAGTVTMHWNADMYVVVGPQWGQIEVKNANGTWTGPCTAGGWGSQGQIVAGCWLTGTGAYKGFTAYFSLNAADPDALKAVVEGVIFPGAVPKF